MTTFTYRSYSLLFYGPYPRLMYSPKINLDLAENYPDGWQSASGRPKAARHQQQVSHCGTSFWYLLLEVLRIRIRIQSICFWSSWIRIRIHKSDVWIRILLSSCKNSRKTLILTICDSFWLLSLKNDVKVPIKSNVQKNFFFKLVFCWHLEGEWWK